MRNKYTAAEQMLEVYEDRLKNLHDRGLYRPERPVMSVNGVIQYHTARPFKPMVTFNSNDYLGVDVSILQFLYLNVNDCL